MKIVLFDIETSLMKVTTFGLYNERIPHSGILQDWSIICACWKVLGQNRVYCTAVTDDEKRFNKDPNDDLVVVKELRKVFMDADILVGHNLDKFDVKKFNARLIYHGLRPVPPKRTVDTLKEAKKVAKFTSNRLDYLGKFLGFGGKIHTEAALWLRALEGDAKAIKDMVVYCKRDVRLLEDVYLKLRPYMLSHPNIASVGKLNCPKCNSDHVIKHKQKISAAGIVRQQYQCQNCYGYFTERVAETEKPRSGR